MLKAKLKILARRRKVLAFSLQPFALGGSAFTLIEVLVVVVLLSFIVLSLMAVFNSTQAAFRASITQSDVLEGGRSVMGLIRNDLDSLTPSFGQYQSNANPGIIFPVNFAVATNTWQYQSNALPLVQSLVPLSTPRTNVLQNFFLLTRQNQTWTGVGYFVDTGSTNYLNPLYRFTISTNVGAASPILLYGIFTNTIVTAVTNMSHLIDGVLQLTVRAYDPNGRWMTNGYPFGYTNLAKNAWFAPPTLGESSLILYSNTLPASVEVDLGVLEDRSIQRAESLFDVVPPAAPTWLRSNYLAQQSGKVHLFRQRVPIRNVDPSAYP